MGIDPDELLRLLDLDGVEASPAADTLAAGPSTTEPDDAGPTALELDEWGLRRGRDLLADRPDLAARGLGEWALADFHAAAFVPEPMLRPGCADRLRHEFLKQLLETPEYRALHATTLLRDVPAALAAAAYAEQFAALRDEREGAGRGDGAVPPPATAGRPADAHGAEMAVVRAVARALEGAAAEVDACREACAALGLGPGAPGSVDPRAVAALYRRVRSSPTLRRIVDHAGRFRRVAQSRQRQKCRHGLDDVVGVEPGGDVGRLLPAELARLVLPGAELDALRRIAERQALCREHRAAEPVGKGPVLVAVDESGSMAGDRAHTAKALALAVAWAARRQRRWCGLIAYSGDTGERVLALPPGRWDEQALVSWLEAFLGGGSDLDVPVRELPRIYDRLRAPAGATDVLFLTDALCRLEPAVRSAFAAWKPRAKARLVTLVVGGEPGDLLAISDECHRVPTLAADDPAVGRVLSL